MRRVAVVWGPVVAYCGAIAIASSIPGSQASIGTDLPVDKLVHFCEYAPLGALLFRAFRLGPPRFTVPVAFVAAVIAGLLYGISDELHQILTPGRDADPADVVADLLGSATGAALARVFYARIRK